MVIGDQMTCKNMGSAKHWRQPEVNAQDRLTWVKEIPGIYIHVYYVQRLHMHTHRNHLYVTYTTYM